MPDLGAFDPVACDLCGATEIDSVVDVQTGRALRSDRVVVPRGLKKIGYCFR